MSQNALALAGNACVFKAFCQFTSAKKPPSVSESQKMLHIFEGRAPTCSLQKALKTS